MELFKIPVIFLASLTTTLILLPRLSQIAQNVGLLDHPNGRKVHLHPKPLVGGIGMIIALFLCGLLFVPLGNLRGFYAGIIVLAISGFFDDYMDLSHRWNFVAQTLAVVFMIYFSSTRLVTFGNLFSLGSVDLGIFAIPLTIFCVIGVINAMNMIDGIDGLAGGISVISFLSFALLAHINHQPELTILTVVFAGAVIGFLRYNWIPASLFMGNSGSFAIGFSLAFISIAITQKGRSLVPPVAPLLILAVPIVDTITVTIKRIMKGRSPFQPDRTHLHHILMRLGFSRKKTVIAMLLLSLTMSCIGILGTVYRIPHYYLFFIFIIYSVTYFWSSFHIKEMMKLKRKHKYASGILTYARKPVVKKQSMVGYFLARFLSIFIS